LSGLTIVLPLAFPLTLKSGQVIETVGDAASYFATLTEEKRGHSHWQVAVRMLNNALDQPTYLKTATIAIRVVSAYARASLGLRCWGCHMGAFSLGKPVGNCVCLI
jgi:hypothetical protein